MKKSFGIKLILLAAAIITLIVLCTLIVKNGKGDHEAAADPTPSAVVVNDTPVLIDTAVPETNIPSPTPAAETPEPTEEQGLEVVTELVIEIGTDQGIGGF